MRLVMAARLIIAISISLTFVAAICAWTPRKGYAQSTNVVAQGDTTKAFNNYSGLQNINITPPTSNSGGTSETERFRLTFTIGMMCITITIGIVAWIGTGQLNQVVKMQQDLDSRQNSIFSQIVEKEASALRSLNEAGDRIANLVLEFRKIEDFAKGTHSSVIAARANLDNLMNGMRQFDTRRIEQLYRLRAYIAIQPGMNLAKRAEAATELSQDEEAKKDKDYFLEILKKETSEQRKKEVLTLSVEDQSCHETLVNNLDKIVNGKGHCY